MNIKLPKSEASYVKHKLSLFLQLHEVYINDNKKSDNESCKKLSEVDKKKWDYGKLFLDDFREAFLNCNNCLTWQDIDGRKNPDCDEMFLEMVLFKHNDPTWCPQSEPFDNWGVRLKYSHLLPLHTKLTLKDVQESYTKMKGVFNKMINMYKSSGNGDLNIQDSVSNGSDTNNKSKGNSDDNFTDNGDKQNFCFNSANYGYFWALAEWNQLTNTVSQNCNSIVVSSAESSDISMTSNSTTTSPSKKKQNKMNIEDKTDQMISAVMGIREEMKTVTSDHVILLLKIELWENTTHCKSICVKKYFLQTVITNHFLYSIFNSRREKSRVIYDLYKTTNLGDTEAQKFYIQSLQDHLILLNQQIKDACSKIEVLGDLIVEKEKEKDKVERNKVLEKSKKGS
jgi:hypothetical protein